MQLFYTKDIDKEIITLNEEESRHAIKVLRKSVGDTLHIVDGDGTLFCGEIIEAHHKHTLLKVVSCEKEFSKLKYNLHIAIAPTKSIDRVEWFAEKATEIGVSTITPIRSHHSERKEVKVERLERVVVSGMKQSIKAYKPKINEITPFSQFVNSDFGDSDKYIAHCNGTHIKPHISKMLSNNPNITIMIGPEGDFSPEEVEMALSAGFKEISLGDERLRSETAALYATTAVAINFCK